MDQNVRKFNITMHDLLLVYLFESGDYLLEDDACLDLGEVAASHFLQVFEVPAVAQLHDQVEVILGALQVFETNNIGAVDFCQDVYFIFYVVEQSRGETLLLDHFHCIVHVCIVFSVASVHLPELSFT